MTPGQSGSMLLAALLACSQTAGATTAAETLAHCTSIDAPDARLGCYDAAAGRSPQHAARAGADTASATPAAPARPAAPATPVAVVHGDDPRDFGLTPAQRVVAPSGPESIRGRIAGLSSDRIGHAVVTLDNGQTWYVSDNDSRLEVGHDVTIKRAALGSYLMTTADRHAYHVRRTR